MIARITLTMGPREVFAILGDDFNWRCEDLLTQTYLNSCHGPDEEGDLGGAVPGYEQAVRASKAVERAGWDVNLYVPALNQNVA